MIEYFALNIGDQLPELSKFAPYRCIILTVGGETKAFRTAVSEMLIDSGCRYIMAWGKDCTLWDDWVDETLLARFDFGDIPAQRAIMTTWHDGKPLEEVLYFAKFHALKSADDQPLEQLIILDIGAGDRRDEILAQYADAKSAW